MNPLILKILGSGVRYGLVFAAPILARYGIGIGDVSPELVGGVVGFLMWGYSAFRSRKDTQKRMVAQAAPFPMTETEIDEKIKSGDPIPSVLTPKDVVPVPVAQ